MQHLTFKNWKQVVVSLAGLWICCVVVSFIGNYIFTAEAFCDVVNPFNRNSDVLFVAKFFEALFVFGYFAWISMPFSVLDLIVDMDAFELNHGVLASKLVMIAVPVYWLIVLVLLIGIFRKKSILLFAALATILLFGSVKSIVFTNGILNAV
ncbi:MAG: hypothetical protein JXX14_05210 [Deltaproteobacteria bacterium]|nr:hypothetical protein [Deltaproteobacteria bacterium]